MDYKTSIHWLSLGSFALIFGWAGLKKILKEPGMVEGMASIGFNELWTLGIGTAEILGVAGVLLGMLYPSVKNISVLWLLPFGIGAFTIHMSYGHTFSEYWQSLAVCILAVIVLWTDKVFKIIV